VCFHLSTSRRLPQLGRISGVLIGQHTHCRQRRQCGLQKHHKERQCSLCILFAMPPCIYREQRYSIYSPRLESDDLALTSALALEPGVSQVLSCASPLSKLPTTLRHYYYSRCWEPFVVVAASRGCKWYSVCSWLSGVVVNNLSGAYFGKLPIWGSEPNIPTGLR